MAEDKQLHTVDLYDANGGFVERLEHDEDMMAAANRNRSIEFGGARYQYDARTNRWVEGGDTVKLSSRAKVAVPEAAPAAATEKK